MTKLTLLRYESSSQGTFGKLLQFYTGELPSHDNRADISCIPVGVYKVRWTYSPHLRRFAYVLENVPKRAGCRIHSANLCGDCPPYRKQLNGCISLALRLGYIDGQKAVLESAVAVRQLETLLERKDFILEIKNVGD